MNKRLKIAVTLFSFSAVAVWAAEVSVSQDHIVNRIAKQENMFITNIRNYSPLLETYIQNLKPDVELGAAPSSDQYFLGRLDTSNGVNTIAFVQDRTGLIQRLFGPLTGMGSMKYSEAGFATIIPDRRGLDTGSYDFSYVRREFLGEVRCLVFDVSPKKHTGQGRFLGRIWVEDQNYNIVRFNGTYTPRPRFGYYFHFDSWRLNMGPNLWLPAYIYSEESDMNYSLPRHHLSFKAQTRLWGYNVRSGMRQDELTQVLVDPAPTISDRSDAGHDLGPVESMRRWHAQAEENVIDRLQRAALISPEGEVDKILNTVVNNLVISNKLNVQPEIQCRVLLTAPLETFSIGNTIVISRGLIDVLPDEATLAAVLAHEMGHILLQHSNDSKYGFNDRMIFPDQEVFKRVQLGHKPEEEKAADDKALELLKNSPYKDQLGNTGLFLRALQKRAPELPHLIRAHLGNGLALGNNLRLGDLLASAPELDVKKIDQIAALPLGARVKVDPWNDRMELSKAKPVALLSAREKMMFEVTPLFPWMARAGTPATEKVATNTQPGAADPAPPTQQTPAPPMK